MFSWLFGIKRKASSYSINPDWISLGTELIAFDSLYAGLALVGATGSGKSSLIALLLKEIARHKSRPAVVHCCVKRSEGDAAEAIYRKAGRSADVIRLRADGPWTIDLFGYLLGPLGMTSEGIASFLDRLAALVVRNTGSGPDKTWAVQATQLQGKCLDLFKYAAKAPSPLALFEVLVSVPKDAASAQSEAFLQSTACGQLIVQAQLRNARGELTPEERIGFGRAVEYVLTYLPSLGDRFLGSVIGTAVTGLGQLLQPPFDRLFSGPTSLIPSQITAQGKVLILDLPCVAGPAAAVAQSVWTQILQMHLLNSPAEGRRPTVIVRDEAQYLVVPDWDYQIQTIARSHGIISLTAVQGYPPLINAFGGNESARVQAEAFLGSHASHVVLNPGADAETRKKYSELFGQERQILYSGGQMQNPEPGLLDRLYGISATPTISWSEQMLPVISQEMLTRLKRGGREHRFIIEAMLFQAGRIFPETGYPFVQIEVAQDLTP